MGGKWVLILEIVICLTGQGFVWADLAGFGILRVEKLVLIVEIEV